MLSLLQDLFSRVQTFPAKAPARRPAVLAITPCYMDQLALRIASSRQHWDLLICPTLRSGLRTLRKCPVSVIVYDLETHDAPWRQGIRLLLSQGGSACLIALSKAWDDDLWETALACGVYDVQTKPLGDPLLKAVQAAHTLIESHELPFL
jgi:hypothetical protein